MSENSSQEKTEQPTEKRLKKAKEDGQVARSKELNTAILLMVSIAGLLWFAFFGQAAGQILISGIAQADDEVRSAGLADCA